MHLKIEVNLFNEVCVGGTSRRIARPIKKNYAGGNGKIEGR
jgi:hypothetical protein